MTELKITNNITLIKVGNDTVLHLEDRRIVHSSNNEVDAMKATHIVNEPIVDEVVELEIAPFFVKIQDAKKQARIEDKYKTLNERTKSITVRSVLKEKALALAKTLSNN